MNFCFELINILRRGRKNSYHLTERLSDSHTHYHLTVGLSDSHTDYHSTVVLSDCHTD